jgi:hypothetical protein
MIALADVLVVCGEQAECRYDAMVVCGEQAEHRDRCAGGV